MLGPLDDGRGRLATLLHLLWMLARPVGPHVLAAQRAALPELTALAERPGTRELFQQAAARGITLAGLSEMLPETRPPAPPCSPSRGSSGPEPGARSPPRFAAPDRYSGGCRASSGATTPVARTSRSRAAVASKSPGGGGPGKLRGAVRFR